MADPKTGPPRGLATTPHTSYPPHDPPDSKAGVGYLPVTGVGGTLDDALRVAASQGHHDRVHELLQAGAAFTQDGEGRTALHYATYNGHADLCRLLINEGCNLDIQDSTGYTALQRACSQGHVETVEVCLQAGCGLDIPDEHGNTSIHEAAWHGYSRTVELLIKYDVNVFLTNKSGFTALHLSAQNGHNESSRSLLYGGLDPDLQNNYGDTALHTAARYGHAGVTRILISAKCKLNLQNKNGDTVLHIAAALKRRKIAKILVESHADVFIQNKQGETAVDVARRKDHPEITIIINSLMRAHTAGVVRPREAPGVTFQEEIDIDDGPMVCPDDDPPLKPDKPDKDKGFFSFFKKKKKDKDKDTNKDKTTNQPNNAATKKAMLASTSTVAPTTGIPARPVTGFFSHYMPRTGTQYYRDLAGNIKQGPVGYSPMCQCKPVLQHIERTVHQAQEKLYGQIEASHQVLQERIRQLDQLTSQQTQTMDQGTRERLEAERRACQAALQQRLHEERQHTQSMVQSFSDGLQTQVQTWLEDRLSSYGHCLDHHHDDSALPPNHIFTDINYGPNGGRLFRSRSDETLSASDNSGKGRKRQFYESRKAAMEQIRGWKVPTSNKDVNKRRERGQSTDNLARRVRDIQTDVRVRDSQGEAKLRENSTDSGAAHRKPGLAGSAGNVMTVAAEVHHSSDRLADLDSPRRGGESGRGREGHPDSNRHGVSVTGGRHTPSFDVGLSHSAQFQSHPQGHPHAQAPPTHPKPGHPHPQAPPTHPKPGHPHPQAPPTHPKPGHPQLQLHPGQPQSYPYSHSTLHQHSQSFAAHSHLHTQSHSGHSQPHPQLGLPPPYHPHPHQSAGHVSTQQSSSQDIRTESSQQPAEFQARRGILRTKTNESSVYDRSRASSRVQSADHSGHGVRNQGYQPGEDEDPSRAVNSRGDSAGRGSQPQHNPLYGVSPGHNMRGSQRPREQAGHVWQGRTQGGLDTVDGGRGSRRRSRSEERMLDSTHDHPHTPASRTLDDHTGYTTDSGTHRTYIGHQDYSHGQYGPRSANPAFVSNYRSEMDARTGSQFAINPRTDVRQSFKDRNPTAGVDRERGERRGVYSHQREGQNHDGSGALPYSASSQHSQSVQQSSALFQKGTLHPVSGKPVAPSGGGNPSAFGRIRPKTPIERDISPHSNGVTRVDKSSVSDGLNSNTKHVTDSQDMGDNQSYPSKHFSTFKPLSDRVRMQDKRFSQADHDSDEWNSTKTSKAQTSSRTSNMLYPSSQHNPGVVRTSSPRQTLVTTPKPHASAPQDGDPGDSVPSGHYSVSAACLRHDSFSYTAEAGDSKEDSTCSSNQDSGYSSRMLHGLQGKGRGGESGTPSSSFSTDLSAGTPSNTSSPYLHLTANSYTDYGPGGDPHDNPHPQQDRALNEASTNGYPWNETKSNTNYNRPANSNPDPHKASMAGGGGSGGSGGGGGPANLQKHVQGWYQQKLMEAAERLRKSEQYGQPGNTNPAFTPASYTVRFDPVHGSDV